MTTNRKWLDSYIPSVVGRVKEHGIDVVFDRNSDFDVMHIHIPMTLAYRLSMSNNNGSHKPSIFHGHMTEDTFFVARKVKYFIRRWFKSIAQKSDIILCPSISAAEYYHDILLNMDIRLLNYGIEDGKTVVSCVGGVLQRKGVDEFAAHIKSLTDDQELADRMGREACLSATRHHDIYLTSATLAGIYMELAG